MLYTLITPRGRIYTFTIRDCALTFQSAYGGTLFTNDILVDTQTQKTV